MGFARVVNYSGKTQFIAKINKGLGKTEDRAVNEYMPDEQRPIPYKQMIYFGDGMTDIPSMKIVKNNGGTVLSMVRFEVGEGMQKREENFAEEVMSQIK